MTRTEQPEQLQSGDLDGHRCFGRLYLFPLPATKVVCSNSFLSACRTCTALLCGFVLMCVNVFNFFFSIISLNCADLLHCQALFLDCLLSASVFSDLLYA